MNRLTFKVQLTPTQSERFQKEVFAKGGTWVEGETTVILTMNPFMILQQGKMCTSSEYDERYFQNYLAPEVLTEQAFKLVADALPLKEKRDQKTPLTLVEDWFQEEESPMNHKPSGRGKVLSSLVEFIENLPKLRELILSIDILEKKEGK